MICQLLTVACPAGTILPLYPNNIDNNASYTLLEGQIPEAGWELVDLTTNSPVFLSVGKVWLPFAEKTYPCALLKALRAVPQGVEIRLKLIKNGNAVAVITLSDKGAAGQRQDIAGPLAASMLEETITVSLCQNFILPDDKAALRGLLADLALIQKYDLICTCGGTGLGARDITPQVTASLLDYEVPGFGEAMRTASLAKTPNAIISRAVCGVIGQCLVLNLPGSAKAVRENLAAVLPGLGHALAKLQGDPADCGG